MKGKASYRAMDNYVSSIGEDALATDKFREDLTSLTLRLLSGASMQTVEKLNVVKTKLFYLRDQNLVKINHSAMELVCAYGLILAGYDVVVEEKVSELLICDVLGVKGEGRAIVEVETGFVPPDHALDPSDFFAARVISKIARYSQHSEKFILGALPYCVLPIPALFQKPPSRRVRNEIVDAKNLCDKYYLSPPISLDEIWNARLHSIYVIDIDRGKIKEMDPESYLEATQSTHRLMFSGV